MFNMSRKEALKLAKLAETNPYIREMITPAGLAWLDRINRPWYVRLWRRLRLQRGPFARFCDNQTSAYVKTEGEP